MVQLINKESCHDLLMNNHELHIIDVRSAEDYYAGHLPRARNLDIMQYGSYTQLSALDPSKAYLFYCNTGLRSNSILRILEALGFNIVYVLQDGLIGWDWSLVKD